MDGVAVISRHRMALARLAWHFVDCLDTTGGNVLAQDQRSAGADGESEWHRAPWKVPRITAICRYQSIDLTLDGLSIRLSCAWTLFQSAEQRPASVMAE